MVRLAVGLGCLVIASGCSLFLDYDSLTNGDASAGDASGGDASQPPDAASDAMDGGDASADSSGDAALDAGSDGALDCNGTVLCDDFEGRASPVGAARVAGWSLASTTGTVKFAPGLDAIGLLVSAAAGDKAWLHSQTLSVGPLARYTVELDFYLGSTTYTGSDSRGLVNLYANDDPSVGVFGLYVGSIGVYLASTEFPSGDAVPNGTGQPVTIVASPEWHHLKMQITFSTAANGTCAAWLDGTKVLVAGPYQNLSAPISMATLELQSDTFNGAPPALDIRFDNVQVWAD